MQMIDAHGLAERAARERRCGVSERYRLKSPCQNIQEWSLSSSLAPYGKDGWYAHVFVLVSQGYLLVLDAPHDRASAAWFHDHGFAAILHSEVTGGVITPDRLLGFEQTFLGVPRATPHTIMAALAAMLTT